MGLGTPLRLLFPAFLSVFVLHSDLGVCPLEEAGAVSASLSESQAQL